MFNTRALRHTVAFAATAALLLVPFGATQAQQAPTGPLVYAITATDQLVTFNASTPGTVSQPIAITGLAGGESIEGIDVRPATGQLFALGSSSRLYVIEPSTGAATPVGASPFTPALNGTAFGFDFNPTVDRIRVVSDEEQNLRLNPLTGGIAGVDSTLVYTNSWSLSIDIVGAAYTNSVPGTTSTTLYVVDAAMDVLAIQNPPNAGVLTPVGEGIGVNLTRDASFDIAPGTNRAYLADGGKWHTVNLTTGVATLVGALGNNAVEDIAIAAQPFETIYGLTANNALVSFNSARPGSILTSQPVSGLPAGETLRGIDFRPANGLLYGVSTASRIYTIDTRTGAALPANTGTISPTVTGTGIGIDFNPVPDRLRVVTDSDQNLRINVDTSATIVDGTLVYTATDIAAGQNPAIVAAGYTNNVAGATSTTLYVIDGDRDTLLVQNPPNNGVLTTIGSLGVNVGADTGMDISPTGAAFVSYTIGGAPSSTLGMVNPTSGAVTALGTIGGAIIRDIAIPTAKPVQRDMLYVVTADGQLASFLSSAPGVILSQQPITGLQAGEQVQGIDFRPATGQLLAVGSTSRLYTINPRSGAATVIGAAPFTPALNGTSFGFDFNPTVDRIRLVSDAEQDLRLNPLTGGVAAVDGTLAYTTTSVFVGQDPAIVGAAYTNNVTGTTSTTLYVLDAATNSLAIQNPPNAGVLTPVGPLGVDVTASTGFDITRGGTAYVAITAPNGTTTLGTIDLTSGQMRPIGTIGVTGGIRGLAAPTGSTSFISILYRFP